MATPRQGYRNLEGVKVPSVTTIIGRFKDSGALVQWGYKQGREHENLAVRGLDAPAHLYDVTGKAALAGTIAHDMIEYAILNRKPIGAGFDLPKSAEGADWEVIERARNAFRQFEWWREQTHIVITHTEMGLVSERYQFGGTLDAIGTDAAGNIVLVDWKTSNAVYDDYLYQLGAYSLLLEENHPELAPKSYHLLRVAKETADFAHHYYGELDIEKQIFLQMRRLYGLVSVPRHKRVRSSAPASADDFNTH